MPSNKNYQKLKKIWYKKLEKSGFNDIEQDEEHLKFWSARHNRDGRLAINDAREQYYYMATQFLNDYEFENALDKIIWEYHTNGIYYRDIAILLRKAKVSKISKSTIHLKIKVLVNKMFELYIK